MPVNKVFLFVPNIVGYFRFVFYLISFISHSFGSWQLCIIFYAIAFILDEFDGRAARDFSPAISKVFSIFYNCDRS